MLGSPAGREASLLDMGRCAHSYSLPCPQEGYPPLLQTLGIWDDSWRRHSLSSPTLANAMLDLMYMSKEPILFWSPPALHCLPLHKGWLSSWLPE